MFVSAYTTEDRRAAREAVTGLQLGGLLLEAKDVEVLTKVWPQTAGFTKDSGLGLPWAQRSSRVVTGMPCAGEQGLCLFRTAADAWMQGKGAALGQGS